MAALANPFNTVTPGAQIPSASNIMAYPSVHPVSAGYVSKAQPVVLHQGSKAPNAPPSQMPVLPPAYGQYTYGARMVRWNGRVPVPEENTGIMRNAEFPTKPYQEGVEVAPPDYAVRNMGWRHLGPWAMPAWEPTVPIPDPDRETSEMMSRRLAEAHYKTKDLEPFHEPYTPFKAAPPDFKALKAARDGPLAGLTLARPMTIDLVGDEQLAEFFADPEASLEDNVAF